MEGDARRFKQNALVEGLDSRLSTLGEINLEKKHPSKDTRPSHRYEHQTGH